MAVHNHAAIQVVVEFCFEFIEPRFQFLQRNQTRVFESADVPLGLRAHVEDEGMRGARIAQELSEFARSCFILGAVGISRREAVLIQSSLGKCFR